MHPATLDNDRLQGECEVTRTRRSGPGGQHRNKVETAIVLEHRPTGVRAEAAERRSQPENLKVALFRLRIQLALSWRESAADEPSDLWKSRRAAGRIVVSPTHTDFPSLLAEALDRLAADEFDLAASAARLECTSSQLVKLLQHEPQALVGVNRARQARGLHRLQ